MVDATELVGFLSKVRNARRFRPDTVPEEALAAVLEVARWSGSSMNR